MHGSVVFDTPHSQGRLRLRLFQLFLSHRVRVTVLTAHIIISVGLLGDSAGFLAVAIRPAMADDPRTVLELVNVLNMFSLVFGIPLSFGVLITGVALGLGTRWGSFATRG